MKYGRLQTAPPISTPGIRPWRPWPLRWPFLLGFIALCIALCVGIELVLLACSVDGCRTFNERGNNSAYDITYFTYNQFPTVLGLILNLLWATTHHDVMRLEPYFRMSTPCGASAADSIFLEYPYTFALFIPFVAGKRRHYAVMLSSCIALSLGFIVTPLITGIFDEVTLFRPIRDTAIRRVLRPANENSTCSGNFTYSAYQISWLNGSFPRFTTREYALLPVEDEYGGFVYGQIWTANTTLFEAELTCEGAGTIDISATEDHGIRVNVTSQDGAYTVILCDQINKSPKLSEDIAQANAVHVTNSLAGLGTTPRVLASSDGDFSCDGFTTFLTPWTAIAQRVMGGPIPGNGSEVYLFGWASSVSSPKVSAPPRPTNITALFCNTNYYSQPVTVRFGIADSKAIDITRVGVRKRFVNLPNFDQIINGEINAIATPTDAKNSAGDLFGLGYPPAQLSNVDSMLQDALGMRPPNMAGLFATTEEGEIDASSHSSVYIDNVNGLAGLIFWDRNSTNLWELLDPEKLAAAYRRALRILFALAVSVEMVDVNRTAGEVVSVIKNVTVTGYGVNRLWARGSQGGLAVVVVVVALLMVLMVRRPCNLDGEPNSLAEALRLLDSSPELAAEMENSEFHDPKELLKVFEKGGGLYRLDLVPEQGPRVIRAIGVREHARLLPLDIEKQEPWTEQLWQLRGVFGGAFLALFAVLGILLSVAFGYHLSLGGLPAFAPINSVGYKVLYSYLPIAVGLAAEPILISIACCFCMLVPYTMLTRKTARGASPLTLDFDKSPPHFQFARSLRTRHVPLVALNVAILLCNVLAVALAGLFSEGTSVVHRPWLVATYPTPTLRRGFTVPGHDMYLLLYFPDYFDLPWTTAEYFVLPFHDIDLALASDYSITTLGIGLDVECGLVPAGNITFHCNNPHCETSPIPQLDETHDYDYSLVVDDQCWDNTIGNYSWKGLSHDNIILSSKCPNTFFPIWVERPWNPHPENGDLYQDHLDALIMTCRTAETVVTLGTTQTSGTVFTADVLHTFDQDYVAAMYTPGGTRLATSFNKIVVDGLRAENNRDSHKIRWLNSLMKTTNPRIVRNVTNMTHLPDPAYIRGAFEKTYTSLFVVNLQQAARDIIDLGEPEPVTVSARVSNEGVRMSVEMFTIAISMIGAIMLLMLLVYCSCRQPVGYIPRNLAGMYALLYASNAKEECGKLRGRNPAERARNLEDFGGSYACGKFRGDAHYGVYRTGMSAGSGTGGLEGEL